MFFVMYITFGYDKKYNIPIGMKIKIILDHPSFFLFQIHHISTRGISKHPHLPISNLFRVLDLL